MAWSKEQDRAITARIGRVRMAWDSSKQGTFNAGRNAKKRERRAQSARWRAGPSASK